MASVPVSSGRSKAWPRWSMASSQRGRGVSSTTRRELRSRRSTQKRGSPVFLDTRTTREAHSETLLRMMPLASISLTALSMMASPAGPTREGAWRKGVAPGLSSTATLRMCVAPGTFGSAEKARWRLAMSSSTRCRCSGLRMLDSSTWACLRASRMRGGRRSQLVLSEVDDRSWTVSTSNETWQMGMSAPMDMSR